MPATEKKVSEPLRILFCGSDEFSCAHLQALHEEHLRNPGLIESIDVVVRPGKRTGRGYKKIQHRESRRIIYLPTRLCTLLTQEYTINIYVSSHSVTNPSRN